MSPATARKIHFGMMMFWAANLILVWFLPSSWRIPYLVIVSIYANVVGHWGGWSAERPSETVEDDGSA